MAEPLKTARLEFPDNDKVRALCGAHNENLKLMEKRLGVQLGLRGSQIVVAAAEEARVRLAEGLVKELYDLVAEGYPLYLEDVDQATKLAGQGVALKDIFGDTVFVSSRHRVITPKGLAQKRYIQ
ncbi:MAG TPA: PhoH family protein, partial [Anaeromyxobacter sp.]|nr:PhoH family protein [Anaeromyxobacter sp.]